MLTHTEGPHEDAARLVALQESAARIVEAADNARRRLERDLHDGAQQRFVSASLRLQMATRHADDTLLQALGEVAAELDAGLAELRELAHGIHPAVLTDRGLRPAIDTLAARCRVPVVIEGALERRPLPAVESALYFVVSEALTNVIKYSGAGEAFVTIGEYADHAEVEVRDAGCGGADPSRGSGLRGLVDRLTALGGHLHVDSAAGAGTRVLAAVPLNPHERAAEPACGCCAEGQCRCAA